MPDLATRARQLRTRAEAIWRRLGPEQRHPDYRSKKKPAAGRCYQTALWLKSQLKGFGTPQLVRGTGDYNHHFWVRVGGKDLDITGDQYGKPKVQVGKLPYGAGTVRSWPSKPAPSGHVGAMVRADGGGRANAFMNLMADFDAEDIAARLGRKFVAVDLFAGAGGASQGIFDATGVHPVVAVNHDLVAISTHKRNHPENETIHFHRPILKVDPRKAVAPGVEVDLLWASPDCRHYSRMTGKSKLDPKVRALPWVIPKWMEVVRPRVVVVENVPEMQSWGPLGDDRKPIKALRGVTWNAWIKAMRALGYTVDWRVLNSADYGAPTARRRLFIIATREGRPRWPAVTHGPGKAMPHRQALEFIDPMEPIKSVLKDKIGSDPVKRRIVRAMVRWAQEEKPALTQVRGETYALALVPVGFGEAKRAAGHMQALRTQDIRKPIGTIVAGGKKHALAMFKLGGRERRGIKGWIRAWGPATPRIDGRPVTDILFRRLTSDELKLGQGLPASYDLGRGTESKKVHMIGNSVPPQPVAAIVRANAMPDPSRGRGAQYEDEGFVGEFWGSAGAGVLFRALESKRFLLMLRSGEVEQPGVWGIPGGAVPRSRSGKRMGLWVAARREAVEETGWDGGAEPRGSFQWVDPRGSGFTFTTFLVDTLLEFEPELNWESDDYDWVTLDEARGMDLHPGVQWLVEQMS